MWAIIGTWRMSLEAIEEASKELSNGQDSEKALVDAIKIVEDFPYFKSVGYGGLPNKDMEVELDAAFMNGSNYNFGAVGAVKNIKNPVEVAHALSKEKVNNFLVASGAERYADAHCFTRQNMLSERAIIHYKNRLFEENKLKQEQELKPYIGHDTVGMCVIDTNSKVCAATSTSGLFMKNSGRLGDSPVIGSGLYADSDVGAATATGLGEDLMKGCISYEIVRLMKEGLTPQEACEKAVNDLDELLKKRRKNAGDLSVVAIDNKGNFGVATNIDGFSFVYASDTHKPTVYLVKREGSKNKIEEASKEWLEDYMRTRTAKLEIKG